MRNVVLFLNDERLNEDHLLHISTLIYKEDHICALYELPIVNNINIPLIGDLVEIRYKKVDKLIHKWFDPLLNRVNSFKTLITQNIKNEKLELVCEESHPIVIIGAKQDLYKAPYLFSKETLESKVSSILI